MTITILDPLIKHVISILAADRPYKSFEVLDGLTEARQWLISMSAFHLGGDVDRNAVQMFISVPSRRRRLERNY